MLNNYNLPMPQGSFFNEMEAGFQQYMLGNTDEMRKEAAHRRSMGREEKRSELRQSEATSRQLRKIEKCDFYQEKYSVIIEVHNGLNELIEKRKLFSCGIMEIWRYHREGDTDWKWQMILITENGTKIESPLYSEKILGSISELKKTVLGVYDCSPTSYSKILWKWIQQLIIFKLEQAKTIEIPSKIGWFEEIDKVTFWLKDDKKQIFTEEMALWHVRKFDFSDIKQTTESMLNDISKNSNQESGGIMLVLGLTALLGRMVVDIPFDINLTLIGENADQIARECLSTMVTQNDIVNLDSDRINYIKKRMLSIQDTPIIFVSAAPEYRSTQNRIEQVSALLKNGCMEGKKIRVLGVFCLKSFSKFYPLDNTVVLNTKDLSGLRDPSSFAKIRYTIITQIEGSGKYWIEALRRSYEESRNSEEEASGMIQVMSAISKTVINMFNSLGVDRHLLFGLNSLLDAGTEEIRRQLISCKTLLIEVFREKTKDLAARGQIAISSRDKVTEGTGEEVIYVDSELYYFTANAFSFICDEAKIDKKSVLFVKQQLSEQGCLKMYRATSGRSAELQIDFRISNGQGEYKDLSGLAVVHNFFDEIGGVGLYELCSEE